MTEPYYQDDYVTLYHGDATEIDEWLLADVLVTDPPYGVDFVSARRSRTDRFERIAGDSTTEIRDRVLEAWGPRPAIVFGTWRAPRPDNIRQRLIWAKGDDPGLGDLSFPWGYGDEEMYILGGGVDRQTANKRLQDAESRRIEQPGAPDTEAGATHGKPARALPDGMGCRRPIRRVGRNAHCGPQSGPQVGRDRARRALLRDHCEATRIDTAAADRYRAASADLNRGIRPRGVTW